MSEKNTGGPAFPVNTENVGTSGACYPDSGMSLRDYFAAHAPEVPCMQTFPIKQWHQTEVVELGGGMKGPRNVLHQESWAERSARWAAEYADAMLAGRTK